MDYLPSHNTWGHRQFDLITKPSGFCWLVQYIDRTSFKPLNYCFSDSSRGEGSADCGHVDEMVTEELCHYISPYIGSNWRDVLRNLSMNEVTIRNLEEDHKSYGVVEKCYLGLLRWKESVGPQLATIKKLCRALHITVGCSKALEVLRHKTVQGCST